MDSRAKRESLIQKLPTVDLDFPLTLTDVTEMAPQKLRMIRGGPECRMYYTKDRDVMKRLGLIARNLCRGTGLGGDFFRPVPKFTQMLIAKDDDKVCGFLAFICDIQTSTGWKIWDGTDNKGAALRSYISLLCSPAAYSYGYYLLMFFFEYCKLQLKVDFVCLQSVSNRVNWYTDIGFVPYDLDDGYTPGKNRFLAYYFNNPPVRPKTDAFVIDHEGLLYFSDSKRGDIVVHIKKVEAPSFKNIDILDIRYGSVKYTYTTAEIIVEIRPAINFDDVLNYRARKLKKRKRSDNYRDRNSKKRKLSENEILDAETEAESTNSEQEHSLQGRKRRSKRSRKDRKRSTRKRRKRQ